MPILCIHGAGSSALMWTDAVEELARLGCVIAYDRGGSTRSERPEPYERTSVAEQVEAMMPTIADYFSPSRDRVPRRMEFKLELIPVPVSDVDRAKAFYEQAGFAVDNDVTVKEGLRFIQLTPPGSACSVSIGEGITEMEPGSQQGLQLVVDDIEAARDELTGRGLEVSEIQDFPWGRFVFFSDPDGNGWAVQQIPDYGEGRTQPEGF